MQIVPNTVAQAYQAPFIRSFMANFCGKMVCFINQAHLKIAGAAQLKISETTQRIALIAISLLSLVVLGYWIIKNCSRHSSNQPQPPSPPLSPSASHISPDSAQPLTILKSEIECAKQAILQDFNLDDSKFAKAKSVKIFFGVQHGDYKRAGRLETGSLTQAVKAAEIINELDLLTDKIANQILDDKKFDPNSETTVGLGIRTEEAVGGPALWSGIAGIQEASATAHNGKIIRTCNIPWGKGGKIGMLNYFEDEKIF